MWRPSSVHDGYGPCPLVRKDCSASPIGFGGVIVELSFLEVVTGRGNPSVPLGHRRRAHRLFRARLVHEKTRPYFLRGRAGGGFPGLAGGEARLLFPPRTRTTLHQCMPKNGCSPGSVTPGIHDIWGSRGASGERPCARRWAVSWEMEAPPFARLPESSAGEALHLDRPVTVEGGGNSPDAAERRVQWRDGAMVLKIVVLSPPGATSRLWVDGLGIPAILCRSPVCVVFLADTTHGWSSTSHTHR